MKLGPAAAPFYARWPPCHSPPRRLPPNRAFCPLAAAIARHEAASRAWEAADERMGLALDRLHALPALEVPAVLLSRVGDHHRGIPFRPSGQPYDARDVAEIVMTDPPTRFVFTPRQDGGSRASGWGPQPWPEAQARRDAIVLAWREHETARQAREDAVDLTGALAEKADAQRELDASVVAITSATATTLVGVLRKAQIVMAFYEDRADLEQHIGNQETHDVQIALSIVRDLVDQRERLAI